jgi:hypothetical protein
LINTAKIELSKVGSARNRIGGPTRLHRVGGVKHYPFLAVFRASQAVDDNNRIVSRGALFIRAPQKSAYIIQTRRDF